MDLLLVCSLLVIKDEEQGVDIELFEHGSRFEEPRRRRLGVIRGSGVRVLRDIEFGSEVERMRKNTMQSQ